MAFSGHMDSDGEFVLNDEIYAGRTRISSLSTTSEPSEQSDNLTHSERSGMDSIEFLSSHPWEPSHMPATTNLTYNDKGQSSSSSSTSTPLSLPPADCSTYSRSGCRNNSPYSYSDMYGSLKHIGTHSEIIPSLGLSSKTGTLDYMRELDGLKLSREPNVAYETWSASKQLLRQQELQRQRVERELEIEKHEERKLQAKLCYEKWLRNKARQAAQLRSENSRESMQQTTLRAASSTTSRTGSSSNKSQAEIREVVQNWWLKKHEEQQRLCREKEHRLLEKTREEQRRKQLAEKAWQKWISKVYEKPKPVPMNQGIDSLRGTISEIYINPFPWQTLKKAQE